MRAATAAIAVIPASSAAPTKIPEVPLAVSCEFGLGETLAASVGDGEGVGVSVGMEGGVGAPGGGGGVAAGGGGA